MNPTAIFTDSDRISELMREELRMQMDSNIKIAQMQVCEIPAFAPTAEEKRQIVGNAFNRDWFDITAFHGTPHDWYYQKLTRFHCKNFSTFGDQDKLDLEGALNGLGLYLSRLESEKMWGKPKVMELPENPIADHSRKLMAAGIWTIIFGIIYTIVSQL